MSANSDELEYRLQENQLSGQILAIKHLEPGQRQTDFDQLYDSVEQHYDEGTVAIVKHTLESGGYKAAAQYLDQLQDPSSSGDRVMADGSGVDDSDDYFSAWENSNREDLGNPDRPVDSFQG